MGLNGRVRGWVNKRGVATSVITAIILSAGVFMQGHFAQAGDDHNLLQQAVETQGEIATLIKDLAEREKAEDVKIRRDWELCASGRLEDPDLCAAARAAFK